MDGVEESETKTLKAEITADRYLSDQQKETLVTRLRMKEWEVFGNCFALIDELIVKDEDYNENNKNHFEIDLVMISLYLYNLIMITYYY